MRFLILFVLIFPLVSLAHPGRLNGEGCHNNKKTGQYECHKLETKTAKTKAKTTSRTSTKDYNCADFSSKKSAQDFYIKSGGPKIDLYDLDRDKDGDACEELK